MAQRKNGTYVLVMSYNQTDLRYYDPTNGKSVKANRKKLESEFKQAGSVYYGYANQILSLECELCRDKNFSYDIFYVKIKIYIWR